MEQRHQGGHPHLRLPFYGRALAMPVVQRVLLFFTFIFFLSLPEPANARDSDIGIVTVAGVIEPAFGMMSRRITPG